MKDTENYGPIQALKKDGEIVSVGISAIGRAEIEAGIRPVKKTRTEAGEVMAPENILEAAVPRLKHGEISYSPELQTRYKSTGQEAGRKTITDEGIGPFSKPKSLAMNLIRSKNKKNSRFIAALSKKKGKTPEQIRAKFQQLHSQMVLIERAARTRADK